MTTVQLPGAANDDSQMVIHTAMSNTDTIIENIFKNTFQNQHVHMG